MTTASAFRRPSFWSLQTAGWFCFLLVSAVVVVPYIRRPEELGYHSPTTLFLDQGLMCGLCFLASLSLRPVCRGLLQRPLSWIALETLAAACSVVVGTAVAFAASRFLIGKPEPIELIEACAKISVVLFLWCNLYFGIKQSWHCTEHRQGPSRKEDEALKQQGVASYASRFTVRTGTKIQVVSADEVEWIAAAGDYTELHTRNGVHLLRETMTSLEKRLDPAKFARIHRSKIVCLACVLELRSSENREYLLKLSDGSQHRSSRTYADRIQRWIRLS